MQKLTEWLSHGAWQGISGIATIIGLLIACVGLLITVIALDQPDGANPTPNIKATVQISTDTPTAIPTATQHQTNSPIETQTDTATSEPSLTQIQSIVTATDAGKSFPCSAITYSENGATLVLTKLNPRVSTSEPIRTGLEVSVLDIQVERGITWYKIRDANGSFLIWIASDNLLLSELCP